MKRIALAGTIVVVAALAAAAFATAGSAQGPATTSLHLVSTSQDSVGFAPKHEQQRQGDRVGFGDRITGDDTGVDRGVCTIIGKAQALCTVEAKLSKGTLSAQILVTASEQESEQETEARWAITGGTGAYDGARGTAVVTPVEGAPTSDIQITLLP